MRYLAVTIVLMMLLGVVERLLAQEPLPGVVFGPSKSDELKWDSFGNADDEFHAHFPKLPSVFLTRRDLKDITGRNTGRIYAAYDEGVVCIVVVFDNSKKGETLDQFIEEVQNRFFSSWDIKFTNDVTVNTDDGKHFTLKKRAVTGGARFFVKTKHSYMQGAFSFDPDHPGVKQFLDYIAMWAFSLDKMRGPPLSPAEIDRQAVTVRATDDPTSSDSNAGSKEEQLLPGVRAIATPKPDAPVVSNDSSSQTNPLLYYDRIFEQNEVTTKAAVVLKPEAIYTEEARNNSIEGVVKLSGVLTRDGKVSDVSVIQALPYGLTENALKAMRSLIFLPARKDDRYVSQKITIEYAFTLK